MKFIGKLLMWIGGSALLYIDLIPISKDIFQAFESGSGLGMSIEGYLLSFSRSVFVFGVICAAGLPELKSRNKKSKPKPSNAKKGS
ncbi:MAG: hypothetical protein H8E25_10885 [Planctomycetes bacterium]|nr:hypothetical protein [Planctomycetota bacterium]